MSALVIRPATLDDLPALAVFMQAHGQRHASEGYLRHCYFANPSGSSSLMIGEQEDRIVGMATTNDHVFQRGDERALVAMPQRVLTDAGLRGQGIFGRLYRAAEQACVERGVDLFLTVTNAASTSIFLERFGYRRLPSPRMVMLLPIPGRPRLLRAEQCPEPDAAPSGESWSMRRDAAHRAWRYAPAWGPGLPAMYLGTEQHPLGLLHATRIRRMGLPFQLLMDLQPFPGGSIPALLHEARRVAWRQGTAGLLLLKEDRMLPLLRRQGPRIERSSGFNLLVKGRDPEHTGHLVRQRFDLAFGDLDFT